MKAEQVTIRVWLPSSPLPYRLRCSNIYKYLWLHQDEYQGLVSQLSIIAHKICNYCDADMFCSESHISWRYFSLLIMLREYQTGIFFMKNLLHIVKRDRDLNALQVCLACFPTYFLFFLSQQPSHVDPKNLCMNGHSLQLQLKAVYNFSVFSRNGITFVILTSFIHMCLLHEHYKHPLQVVVSIQFNSS